jgi:hypothetical protein
MWQAIDSYLESLGDALPRFPGAIPRLTVQAVVLTEAPSSDSNRDRAEGRVRAPQHGARSRRTARRNHSYSVQRRSLLVPEEGAETVGVTFLESAH